MPEIKLQHVVSVSSEDKNYPAENLLKSDGFKKWKSKNVGEKQVTATFQLGKSSRIQQIDIGNESSAFVEVLVGKSSVTDGDFQVILVTSSFMSPVDSRNSQNTTRVRMFGKDSLSKAVLEESWDLVKVVCTQPFNKNTQYGLSFIKLHSTEGSTSSPQKQMALGHFKVKLESGDDIKPGALFANRDKESGPRQPLTGAAAAREASRHVDESGKKASDTRKTTTKRKHSGSDMSEDQDSAHDERGKPSKLRKQSSSTASSSSAKHSMKPPLKRMKTEPSKASKEKEFSRLMEKVVFVLSGFQNPERGKIRDKAIEMGASYKGDWGRGCTHLICAFENTPKYNQVRGKGRIVKKDWIRDCHRERKLLPWRRYRLGKAKSPPPTSDEDDDEVEEKRPVATKQKTQPPAAANDSDDYDASTDAGDTDDEIQRALAGPSPVKKKSPGKSRSPPSAAAAADAVYDESTDDEMQDTDDTAASVDSCGLPVLADFFTGKHFFFYGKFSTSKRRTLVRLVVAYNGSVEEYMTDSINYVITDSDWDKHFDDALADNPKLVFVRSDWISACDDKQKLLPHQKYNIVPN